MQTRRPRQYQIVSQTVIPPVVFENDWHQPWSSLRPRRKEGDAEQGMHVAMRAPFTTMGQPATVPNVLPNWFMALGMPQLDKTKGFRRYHNTGLYRVGFSQYLAQPPKHNFQVVAQLNVSEQGDIGLFTANIVPGSGVGIRTKSAIVGIATRRPSQAFVGSAKIP